MPGALLAGLVGELGERGRGEGRYFGWWSFATKLNKELDIFEVSCRKGDGLEGWYNWLRSMRAAKKEGRLA